ncbi:SIR2 family protein [Promicromonospora sp. NPDC023805]|uniref:SIR2 family NAD-dependent protein deacylase n=1 Tax=Promicromonospora sp. NPDC023805 TaxID=3154696 RepID=UPI0033DB0133
MLPSSLVDAAREGSLVPLIGSGLSVESGMASWDRVVDVLRSHITVGDSAGSVPLDLLETPDAVTRYVPRAKFDRIIREAYGDHYSPTLQHRLIAKLPFRTILTTNFDTLIERSLREHGNIASVISEAQEVRNWREGEASQVVKFHGTVDRPDTLVFGEKAYAELYQSNGLMMSLLRTILATRPVLFLGFGMRDAFVKSLVNHVNHESGAAAHRSHYILVQDDGIRTRHYEDLGLIPIVATVSPDDRWGVTAFLEELAQSAMLEAVDRVSRTRLLVRETERLRDYLGPERRLRVRAALGPFTVPYKSDIDIFGDPEVEAMEAQLRDVTVDFLERDGGSIDLLCNPIEDLTHAMGKGYTRAAYRLRIATFASFVERFPGKIRVAMSERASDANEWIAADRALISSTKGASRDGRLYSYGRVDLNAGLVRQSIRRFDSDFAAMNEASGGNSAFLERVRALLLEG